MAQEAANPWQPRLLVTPYLWLSGIYGTIARQQPGVNVDVGPFQVLGDLVGAPFMGSVEVRFGPIGLLGDVLHIPLSAPVSTRRQPRITAPRYMPDASEPPMRNRNSTG